VIAFDTGPGNMVIDALAWLYSKGRDRFDRNGKRAAKGQVNPKVLNDLMKHPFFRRKPPKSCGREEFGMNYVMSTLRKYPKKLTADDWIATATLMTAHSIPNAHSLFLPDRSNYDEVILCGGGARNATLCRELGYFVMIDRPSKKPLPTTEDYGIPIQAKEGLSFAMLAAARVDRVPANLPQVTGARRRVILGQVSDPESNV
jgi:anhydro-N-acetylmuramic acid kinase